MVMEMRHSFMFSGFPFPRGWRRFNTGYRSFISVRVWIREVRKGLTCWSGKARHNPKDPNPFSARSFWTNIHLQILRAVMTLSPSPPYPPIFLFHTLDPLLGYLLDLWIQVAGEGETTFRGKIAGTWWYWCCDQGGRNGLVVEGEVIKDGR